MEVRFISVDTSGKIPQVVGVRAVTDNPKYRTKIYKADGSFSRLMTDVFKLALEDVKKGYHVSIEIPQEEVEL